MFDSEQGAVHGTCAGLGPARARCASGEGPAPGFGNAPLEDMVAVGAVASGAARVWIRSRRPGRIAIEYWPREAPDAHERVEAEIGADSASDGSLAVTLPGRDGGRALRPGTRYAFRATHVASGARLGEGAFETAPRDGASEPGRFSIAIMSCHQPFDAFGRPTRAGEQMLRAVHRCLDEHDTKLVLMLGDQMYTDHPPTRSLFNRRYFRSVVRGTDCEDVTQCSASQVRRLLHQRYRHFWNIEGWRELMARYPCCPIIDDHELADNWGALPEHGSARWRSFETGARAAYYDYQGARVLDEAEACEHFDYELEYGPAALYVLDLRSNRRVGDDARIYSQDQFRKLRAFLERHAHRHLLFIVFSVPAVHLPRWGARLARALTLVRNEDFTDRWSTAGHVADRDAVLRLLHDHQRAHPRQRLMLLSGDIHIACAHEIAWDDGTPPLVQLVSSGVTNRVGRPTQLASKLSILANRRLDIGDGIGADVRAMRGAGTNPYTRLNVGLVEMERRGETYAARYLVYGHRRGEPVCVYRSRWLC